MAFRFSALLSTSFLLCFVLAAQGGAQAFGRFGYVDRWNCVGVIVDKDGIRTEHAAADTLRFPQPLRQWKGTQTSEMSQTVSVGEFAGSPSKLRQDLASPGFSAYFPRGIRLSLRSTTSPILTWNEGSMEANTGYATPNSPWVIVSFRDAQPPILIAFGEAKTGLKVTGQTGQWTIASEGEFAGWVRICAPLGVKPFAANSASDLGKLSAACAPAVELMSQPVPALIGFSVSDDATGIVAEWTYDRPGALVPFPVYLAGMGGYHVQATTQVRRLDMNTPSGPVFVTDEPKLTLRMTVRRIPTGRAVAVGAPTGTPIGTASYLDYAATAEMALANLISSQDRSPRETASNTVGEFLAAAAYAAEPHTGQRLPYDADGSNLDLVAAHALLMQSTLTTARPTSEPNSLLTSLVWRRDWLTWKMACADPARGRRAGALAALAAAVAPEPERRLDAAMFQAGLAAERGLAVWLSRVMGGPAPGKFLEALPDVRTDLFGKEVAGRAPGFGRTVLSELRAFGDVPVHVIERQGTLLLRWTVLDARAATITLASGYPIEVQAGQNLESLEVSQSLGLTILRALPKDAGMCEAVLRLPEWAAPLPKWLEPPRFVEVQQ